MMTLGVTFLPQNPPEHLLPIARAADQAGLAELWLWEDCFLTSGVAAASAALAVTERLKVGIGILPVPFRNVALCAMEIATLRRLFGERAIVGIGHGVQDWMAQVGARPASPLTLLREYATALRALLDGETVSTDGRYVRLDGVALDWPPDPAPRLLLGAAGPKTLALAGELGDGTILDGSTSVDGVRAAKRQIAAAGGHEIVVFLPVTTGPGAAGRLRAHRERWNDPRAGVAGDAAEIAAVVREYAAAGATKVLLQPTPDDPDPEGFLRFVAHQVRPLTE